MTLMQQFKALLDSLDDVDKKLELLEAFGKIEGAFSDAITSRDKAKEKARQLEEFKLSVKNELGVDGDDIDAKAIKKMIADASKKPDERYETELAKLRGMLQSAEAEKSELNNRYNDLLFKAEIENAGLLKGFKDNPLLRKQIIEHLKGQLIYQDGKIYVNDGNGQAAKDIRTNDYIKPDAIIEQMRSDPMWQDFLAPQSGHGGGIAPQAGKTAGVAALSRAAFQSLPPEQQMQHIKSGGKITE